MPEISLFRLYALRAGYALIVVGVGLTFWPRLFSHSPDWPLMDGVVCSMLAGLSLLAAIGLRYPLAMLPVLLFELSWKTIWLIAIALPLWRAGALDAARLQTVWECLFGAVLIPLIPWRHVLAHYVTRPGAPWRRAAAPDAAPARL